jgi:hypothetical protein
VPVTAPRRRPRSQIVPKGKTEWLAYISEFVEEAKASSFDQKTIVSARAGSRSPHRAIHNERIRGCAIVRLGSNPEMLIAMILSPVCIREPTFNAFDLSAHDGHHQWLMLPAES